MRLHRLEVEAFGPFADAVAVDFDELCEAGLFLLTGATGAGKTSVLDAVCFALYGEVPGDRQAARRLRSDQAPPGAAPRVCLELTLAGRRFRVVRSPAWERPKKRGTGTTTEQASVRLSERVAGEWRLLSSRLDETGHQLGRLLGMNLAQFCQVAMLPQGRFQAFLRARSDERHRLLHQLFRTGRFEEVERWLRDHRLALRRDSGGHHETVADLVSRISEAADEPLPAEWDDRDLERPAGDGSLAGWSDTLRRTATAAADAARARAAAAGAEEQESRAALERARRLARDQQAHAAACAEQERLAAAAEDHQARLARLVTARRAAAVVPMARVAATAGSTADDAARQATRLLARFAAQLPEGVLDGLRAGEAAERRGDALDDTGDDTSEDELSVSLSRTVRRLRDDAATARALLPRAGTLVALREQAAAAAAAVAEAEKLLVTIDEAAALRSARETVAVLAARRQAASRAGALEGELAAARDALAVVVDRVQQRKDAWLRLREERLHGMAAELAGALAVGADCPVCGSVDHPRPAASLPGAPDAEAEKAARSLVDDDEALRAVHEEQVRTLTAALAAARERAGAGDDLTADQDVDQDVDRALAAAEREVARLEKALGESGTADSSPPLDRQPVVDQLARARADHAARTAEAEALVTELARALSGTGADDLADLVAHRERAARAGEAALAARQAAAVAAGAAAEARREALAAAEAAGFADTDAALSAALEASEVEALDTQVREHEAALSQVAAVLADPALRAAAEEPTPDLAARTADHEARAAELGAARAAEALAGARARRLAELDTDLCAALAAWHPLRAELELATRVSALCDGSSADNRLQMRLSGYVLAWRLAQVVAAANDRLGRMSDQRYSLEHTGRRGAGETRGGLSLVVRDDWSGEVRDPATLSGGETFVVSLALALGLADVVAHEVGGAELDTLFVDEGFGSLDADTLDDVMDTLDTLRDGGRVVGVVSHVAEMRDRIPTQLRVAKSRHGSTLAVAHG